MDRQTQAPRGKSVPASLPHPGRRTKYQRIMLTMVCSLLALIFLALRLLPSSPLNPEGHPVITSIKPEDYPPAWQQVDIQPDSEPEAEDAEIELVFTGDLLLHVPILNQGIAEDGSADFSWLFKHTQDILQGADLAFGNMEGTLTDGPYFGYPTFSAPKVFAKNLKDAGFDYLTTVNNHAMDSGIAGVKSTVEALRSQGLDCVGTRSHPDDPDFLVLDCQGIKLAISSFSYETPRVNGLRSLNGAPIPLDQENLLDTFSVQPGPLENLETDAQKLRDRVQAMRAENPDLLIFFMHWGQEYHKQADQWQEFYAQVLANEGVDLVIGGHPHVVQPLVSIPANNDAGQMICYYSLGNFISNQQPDTGNSEGRAEEGAMARVLVAKSSGRTQIKLADYIPLYMYKTYPGYPLANCTYGWALPVERALADPAKYEAEALIPRLEQALASSESVMGQKILLPSWDRATIHSAP